MTGPRLNVSPQALPEACSNTVSKTLPPEPLYTQPNKILAAIRIARNNGNDNAACVVPEKEEPQGPDERDHAHGYAAAHEAVAGRQDGKREAAPAELLQMLRLPMLSHPRVSS